MHHSLRTGGAQQCISLVKLLLQQGTVGFYERHVFLHRFESTRQVTLLQLRVGALYRLNSLIQFRKAQLKLFNSSGGIMLKVAKRRQFLFLSLHHLSDLAGILNDLSQPCPLLRRGIRNVILQKLLPVE